jgi:hypothetical protein
MSEVFDKVMEKAAKQKQMAKERKEMRELAGEINSLVIEATPSGLYSVRYSMSGPVPDELKGMFTRRDHIIAIAQRRNIPIEGVV